MNRRVSAQGWRAAISKGLSIASLTWSQVRARRAKRNSPSSARATNPATSWRISPRCYARCAVTPQLRRACFQSPSAASRQSGRGSIRRSRLTGCVMPCQSRHRSRGHACWGPDDTRSRQRGDDERLSARAAEHLERFEAGRGHFSL